MNIEETNSGENSTQEKRQGKTKKKLPLPKKWYQKTSVQVAMVAASVPIIIAGVNIWHQRSEIRQDNKDLRRDLKGLQSDLGDAKRERDKAENQLERFKAIADLTFPKEPQNKRLELLLKRLGHVVDKVEGAVRRTLEDRTIDPQARRTIVKRLKSVQPHSVLVRSPLGDSEALALAIQITSIFEEVGWEVSHTQVIYGDPVRKLAISLKEETSKEMKRALAPLFDSLKYKKVVYLLQKTANIDILIAVSNK